MPSSKISKTSALPSASQSEVRKWCALVEAKLFHRVHFDASRRGEKTMKNVCGETETLPSLTKTHPGLRGANVSGLKSQTHGRDEPAPFADFLAACAVCGLCPCEI
jgi:hypothetical protein